MDEIILECGSKADGIDEANKGVMIFFAEQLDVWLGRSAAHAGYLRHLLTSMGERIDLAKDAVVKWHDDAVQAEKRLELTTIESSPQGLHSADVAGLVSLGANEALIVRAEAGGRGRPKVNRYLPPAARLMIRLSAYKSLICRDAVLDPARRRRDFDLLPRRDRWVHALVSGELQIARNSGLRGAEARDAAYSEASAALCLHAVKGMRGLSPTAVRRTYRQVETLAKDDREGVVLPPLSAVDFKAWMTEGRPPLWLLE